MSAQLFKKSSLTAAVLASSVLMAPNVSAFNNIAADNDCAGIGGCATGVDFTNDVTLTVNDGTDIGDTGGVSLQNSVVPIPTDNQGKVLFKGDTSISGTIGTAAASLNLFDIGLGDGSGDAKTVIFNGSAFVSQIDFNDDGILQIADGVNLSMDAAGLTSIGAANEGTINFKGSSTVSGRIGAAGSELKNLVKEGAGTVVLNNAVKLLTKADIQAGTVQHFDDLTAPNVTIAAGATLQTAASKTITGAVNNNGTMDLGTNTAAITGTLTAGAGSSISTEVSGATAGNITTTGAATIHAATTLAVNLTGPVADGSVLTIVNDGSAGGLINAPTTVTGGSATYSLSVDTENPGLAGSKLLLTVNRTPLSSTLAGTNPALGSLGGTIDALSATPNSPLAPLVNVVEAQTTPQAIEQILLTVAPTSDGSLWAGSNQSVLQGLHIVNHRMERLRVSSVNSPSYVAGDMNTDNAGWVQIFGSDIDQDARSGFPGYDAWNAGLAIGFDHEFTDNILLGVGFSYAYTNVDSKFFTNNKLDIQTYQAIAYGSWEPMEPWYVDGFLSIAYHDYNTIRNILLPATATQQAFNLRADGEFGAWQFTAAFEGGYDWRINDWLITPHINLRYSHLNVGALQETGAGAFNLYTNYDDVDEFVLGGGVRVGYLFEMENGVVAHPHIFGGVYHDFINDGQSSVSTFFGGGTNFVVPGLEPDDTMFRVGAGVDFACIDNWMVSVNYSADFRDDFLAHGGFVKLRLEWD